MKSLPQIADRLKAAMGLEMATVGASLIERVVRERMAALEMSDDSLYLAMLQTSARELQALIEAAVVPETWFFRDREAILAVVRLARERLARPAGQAQPVRILSLPCSTGEEPYSIAMALLDAGLVPGQFLIDAYDISSRSLQVAAAGVYGRNAFRGQDLAFRDRHFDAQDNEWRLHDKVRQQVRLAAGNLLAADFLRHAAPYDVIFCRNVLIYFGRALQQQVVALLESLMTPETVVFVGPAEGGILLSPRLESAGIPLAFGFRKRKLKHHASIPPAWLAPVPPVHAPAAIRPHRHPAPVPTRPVAAPEVVAAPEQPWLERVRLLADQGHLGEAASLCQQMVQEQGPSAEAFYLQGLIHDAGGDVALAQRCYRKALYLEPQHQAALLHLAALLQAGGDDAGATRMRQRAQRISQPGEGSHA